MITFLKYPPLTGPLAWIGAPYYRLRCGLGRAMIALGASLTFSDKITRKDKWSWSRLTVNKY